MNLLWNIRANAFSYFMTAVFIIVPVWILMKIVPPIREIVHEVFPAFPKPHGVAEAVVFLLIPFVLFGALALKGGKK